MKKGRIIGIFIAIIIVIAAIIIIGNVIKEKGKNYEIEKVEEYNYFVLKQNDLSGVINRDGNTIIKSEFDKVEIPNPEKAVFICSKDEKSVLMNENGEKILTQYGDVEAIRLKNIASDLMYEKSVLKYSENGKYGLIDFTGKEITKPIYDEIDSLPYKEGELIVKENNKLGIINIKGKLIVDIKYDQINVDGYYTEANSYKDAGYIVSNKTEEGYRYGYVNYKGKEILNPEYNELSRIHEIDDKENVYLICAKNGQYGVIKNEKNIIQNEYQSIRYDSTNEVLIVEKSRKYGVSDLQGKLIIPVEYSQIDITGIYLYAQNNQGIAVYNKNGTQVSIDINTAILNTSNDKYRIRINTKDGSTKYGVINKEGKQLIEEKYNYIEYLFDDYFIVSMESGKLGVVDKNDNVKIELENDSIQKVQGTSLLQVSQNSSDTLIVYDKYMNAICEMKNGILETVDNYIKVYNEEEAKYFNTDGKEIDNKQAYPNNALFSKKKGDKWGFVDKNNITTVEYKYDKVTELNEYGFAAVKKDGKWGVINKEGKEIVQPVYEFDSNIEPDFIGDYYKVIYGFGEFYYTNDI